MSGQIGSAPGSATPSSDDLRDALKAAGVALKQAEVPFALCGGFAAWVRGAAEPEHDVDFVVAPGDASRARDVLAAAGFDVVDPPEDWLFKAFRGPAMVDVIHRMGGSDVTVDELARADVLDVLSVRLPVVAATDIVAAKAAALAEHYCDLEPLLAVARALREQVDWDEVARRTVDNPYARAFVFLVGELGISSLKEAS